MSPLIVPPPGITTRDMTRELMRVARASGIPTTHVAIDTSGNQPAFRVSDALYDAWLVHKGILPPPDPDPEPDPVAVPGEEPDDGADPEAAPGATAASPGAADSADQDSAGAVGEGSAAPAAKKSKRGSAR